MSSIEIGFLAFPRLTQLDLTGPWEVLARVPGARLHLVARTREPVVAEGGLTLVPSTVPGETPDLDVLCVPGGPGVDAVLQDDVMLDWLAARAERARWVTSVCTGALALGAAGLLRGYRATTHWLSLDLLPVLGAIPVAERVVVDRNRVTGGGVTAGIDFALTLASELRGEEVARRIALGLEYAPAPPFPGSPQDAAQPHVGTLREATRAAQDERRRLCEVAVARRRGATTTRASNCCR